MRPRILERIPVVSSALVLLFASTQVFSADVRVLDLGSSGQGSLLSRGNECLVLTAGHVVARGAGIQLVLPDMSKVAARVLVDFEEDIALLRTESPLPLRCDEGLFEGTDVDALLEDYEEGSLRMRGEGGDAERMKVSIVGFDAFRSIRIAPQGDDRIKQGFSGGTLYIGGEPVGMLTNIVPDTVYGNVMRAETIVGLLEPFFASLAGERTLHLELDAASEFLRKDLGGLAREADISMGEAADASFRVQVTAVVDERETGTDLFARHVTSIIVTDRNDTPLIEETIESEGNSFVDMNKAHANARATTAEQLDELDIFGEL